MVGVPIVGVPMAGVPSPVCLSIFGSSTLHCTQSNELRSNLATVFTTLVFSSPVSGALIALFVSEISPSVFFVMEGGRRRRRRRRERTWGF